PLPVEETFFSEPEPFEAEEFAFEDDFSDDDQDEGAAFDGGEPDRGFLDGDNFFQFASDESGLRNTDQEVFSEPASSSDASLEEETPTEAISSESFFSKDEENDVDVSETDGDFLDGDLDDSFQFASGDDVLVTGDFQLDTSRDFGGGTPAFTSFDTNPAGFGNEEDFDDGGFDAV
ncbi:MAG: hypothetical protein ACR2P3_08505, partial [Geminicoccaceae bacterium]